MCLCLQDNAYKRAGIVTAEYAKTFYLGTKLMTPEKARAVWAIYVWCRRHGRAGGRPQRQPHHAGGVDLRGVAAALRDLLQRLIDAVACRSITACGVSHLE